VQRLSPDQLLQELCGVEDLLIVQDLDGVCMQLVNDPLTRQMNGAYVMAAVSWGILLQCSPMESTRGAGASIGS
jgi:glucosylglycerol 3-phosphatase